VSDADRAGEAGLHEWDASELGPALNNHARYDGEAESGFDEAEDCIEFAALDCDLGVDALTAERSQHDFSHLVSVAQHDERVAGQVADVDPCCGGDRSVGRYGRYERFVEQGCGRECGVACSQWENDESEIKLPLC
jgi:hypothetical protein